MGYISYYEQNKQPTVLNCVDDIFKHFLNDKGEIEISENIVI